jgi:hypothetical protein
LLKDELAFLANLTLSMDEGTGSLDCMLHVVNGPIQVLSECLCTFLLIHSRILHLQYISVLALLTVQNECAKWHLGKAEFVLALLTVRNKCAKWHLGKAEFVPKRKMIMGW